MNFPIEIHTLKENPSQFYVQYLSVAFTTNTSEAILQSISALFAMKSNEHNLYLYETELVRGGTIVDSEGRKTHKILRKYIRRMGMRDYPLLISLLWNNPAGDLPKFVFTLKKKENEYMSPFTVFRYEQCKNLDEQALKKRLSDINKEEAVAMDKVEDKYGIIKALVFAKLSELENEQQ